MNFLTLLSIFCLIINLYLGLYVFFLDRKSKTNRIFFCLCFIQIIWALGGILMYPAENKEFVLAVLNAGWFVVIPYMALVLHFCLELTKMLKIRPWLYIALYAPVVVFLYGSQNAFLLYKDIIIANGYWNFILSMDSLWSYSYVVFYNLYVLLSVLLLFIWNRKAVTVKDKRQSLVMSVTLLAGLLLSFIEGIILPSFSSYRTPALAPVYATIWMIGIWFSIIKYRFLAISPALVSGDIIANIDELIILTDNNANVMAVNKTSEQLLGYRENELKLRGLYEFVLEKFSMEKEISELTANNGKSFSTRIHFVKKDRSHVLMDTKFKTVHDKFGDSLGILIIGREVRELKQFKSIYKITVKQAEIIRYVLQGKSNKEIARLIGISERTIKGHITAIYHKLRVSNKMELFNLLKDFNLIPEQQAEKSFVVL